MQRRLKGLLLKICGARTPLLIQEGWTRPQERCREATFDGADGVVRHDETLRLADHPVCGAKVGCAAFFLMPQPPLLYQEPAQVIRIGQWALAK